MAADPLRQDYRPRRGENSTVRYRIGSKRDQNGNILPTPSADNRALTLSPQHDWSGFDAAFPNAPKSSVSQPRVVAQPPVVTPPSSPVPAAIPTGVGGMQPVSLDLTGAQPVPSEPDTLQVQAPAAGGVRVPPMNNYNGEVSRDPGRETRAVPAMRAPTPLTSPSGNAATDAANLAENMRMYRPGGMNGGSYSDPLATRASELNQLNDAVPGATAARAAITANAGRTGAGMTPYGPVAVVNPSVPALPSPAPAAAPIPPANPNASTEPVIAAAPSPEPVTPIEPDDAPLPKAPAAGRNSPMVMPSTTADPLVQNTPPPILGAGMGAYLPGKPDEDAKPSALATALSAPVMGGESSTPRDPLKVKPPKEESYGSGALAVRNQFGL